MSASARRLQIGGDPPPDRAYLALRQLESRQDDEVGYDEIEVAPSVDAIGDLWPILRACHDLVLPGGLLTAHRSPHSRFPLVALENLLWLNGFSGPLVAQTRNGDALTARASALQTAPLTCSVIIPCRDEAGNIDGLVRRTPDMGSHTEIIFVDGASTDGTPDLIEKQIALRPDRDMRLLRQTGGGGKAAAVFQGFDAARGDVVMILDADMTVPPEDLPRFFAAIAEGRTDFANGSRFLYAMETGAMQGLNNVGNRAFCAYISWLIDAPIADTLCGTKALRREDWLRIREVLPRFGGHDPWGDFDLLMGAAYVGLSVRDVPIVYRARTAGESKMHAFEHGVELAKTCLAGMRRLKIERRHHTAI
jgi:hypothetical protein